MLSSVYNQVISVLAKIMAIRASPDMASLMSHLQMKWPAEYGQGHRVVDVVEQDQDRAILAQGA